MVAIHTGVRAAAKSALGAVLVALLSDWDRRRIASRRHLALPVACLLGLLAGQAVHAGTLRVAVGGGMVGALTEEQGLFLEAQPLPREGLLAFTRRLCGNEAASAAVAEANGGVRRLLAGVRYQVPYALLRPEIQLQLIAGIFPQDRAVADGWRHTVRGGRQYRETLWRIAEWFTGRGETYPRIRRHNALRDEDVFAGQVLVIPVGLLLPAFRSAVESATAGSEDQAALEYGEDEEGPYGIYRLGAGEALYSSVVVRFTGRIHAEDVNSLAAEIAQRSGIGDVTDIPVGYEVKVPQDLLLPEFLPSGHPRRQEYEAQRTASARFTNRVQARDLQGITVILDAGHGGKDVGASVDGVWESLYVYDIMLRVKAILERETAATVVPTVRDGESFTIEDRERLSFSRRHTVLTTPPYVIEEASVGVALRWYLANSVFRRALKASDDPEKVVFLSLHADSLHPSLRGAMVYVPGLLQIPRNYGKTGPDFTTRKEVLEQPKVTFTRDDTSRSEGLSRDLAQHILQALRRKGLQIHPNNPVRDRVIRRQREWVPAILRYNAVPAKILLEICNLSNPKDRKLMQTRAFRQQIAEATVEGILAYYGDRREPPQVQVAGQGK